MFLQPIYVSRRECVRLGNVVPNAPQRVLHLLHSDKGQLRGRWVHIVLPPCISLQEFPQAHKVSLNGNVQMGKCCLV